MCLVLESLYYHAMSFYVAVNLSAATLDLQGGRYASIKSRGPMVLEG